MKRGAYDVVAKPFQVDQFLLTINRAADKMRLEQRAILFQEENIRNLYDITLEKSRLKTIINCMANGVMVTNRSMEVVLHNPALMRLLNISENITDPFPIQTIIDNRKLIETISRIQNGEAKENEFITQEINIGENTLRAISAPAFGVDRNVFLVVAGAVTEKQRDLIGRINHRIAALIELINDLLDVAKIEAGMIKSIGPLPALS